MKVLPSHTKLDDTVTQLADNLELIPLYGRFIVSILSASFYVVRNIEIDFWCTLGIELTRD
jgi:hypothetical protein